MTVEIWFERYHATRHGDPIRARKMVDEAAEIIAGLMAKNAESATRAAAQAAIITALERECPGRVNVDGRDDVADLRKLVEAQRELIQKQGDKMLCMSGILSRLAEKESVRRLLESQGFEIPTAQPSPTGPAPSTADRQTG
jgi:hypothetical protein